MGASQLKSYSPVKDERAHHRLKTYLKVYACHTNDDRFWALAVYASEQAEPRPSRPKEKVI